MKTESFHVGDILTVILGRLVSPRGLDGLYAILNFMSGESIHRHQMTRVMRECRPYLLQQFPQLDTPEILVHAKGELILMLETPVGKVNQESLVLGWLAKITSGGYGIPIDEMLDVAQLPPYAHEEIDPVSELAEHIHPDRIIVV